MVENMRTYLAERQYLGEEPKALIWDGKNCTVCEDDKSRDGVLDRCREYRLAKRLILKENALFSRDCTQLIEKEEYVIEDSETVFIAENEQRSLLVKKIMGMTFQQMQQLYTEESKSDYILLEWRANRIIYTGLLLSICGKEFLGWQGILASGNGAVYQVQYGGIGNYRDIIREAETIFDRLVI